MHPRQFGGNSPTPTPPRKGEGALVPLALGAVALSLAACAPKTRAPPPRPVELDCSLSFEALSAEIRAIPGLRPAPPEPGEPYRFYSTEDGQASYMITETGAPGHPAILMQARADGAERNTGCAYGDKQGYAQLMAYLTALKPAPKAHPSPTDSRP